MNRAAPLLGLAVATWRLMHVSGPVSVSGTAVVPKDSEYASVRLDGFLEAASADGSLTTRRVPVAFVGLVDVSKPAIGAWTRPVVHVYVERGPDMVGARLEGHVVLSGTAAPGAVSVSGAGILSGDVLVRDR